MMVVAIFSSLRKMPMRCLVWDVRVIRFIRLRQLVVSSHKMMIVVNAPAVLFQE